MIMKKNIFVVLVVMFSISFAQAYEPLIGSWVSSGFSCGANGPPPEAQTQTGHSLIAQMEQIQTQIKFERNGNANMMLNIKGTSCFYNAEYLYNVQEDASNKKKVLDLKPTKITIDCTSLTKSGNPALAAQSIKQMGSAINSNVQSDYFEIVEGWLYSELPGNASSHVCENGQRVFQKFYYNEIIRPPLPHNLLPNNPNNK